VTGKAKGKTWEHDRYKIEGSTPDRLFNVPTAMEFLARGPAVEAESCITASDSIGGPYLISTSFILLRFRCIELK